VAGAGTEILGGGQAMGLFDRATAALSAVGTAWILVLMVLINVDVFGRFLFNTPIAGVPEIVELSIVGIVFLQIGHTLRTGRFIRSDAMIAQLLARRPRFGHLLQAFHHLVGGVLLGIIFYFEYPKFVLAWTNSEYSGAFGVFTIPTWPIKLIILIGSFCACVQFLKCAASDLRIVGGGSPDRPNAGRELSDL
jgi:TRAP-type mannitol/chloroaromatic compound transport system permease small subunit